MASHSNGTVSSFYTSVPDLPRRRIDSRLDRLDRPDMGRFEMGQIFSNAGEMEEKCSIGVARQMSDHKLRRIDAFDIEARGPMGVRMAWGLSATFAKSHAGEPCSALARSISTRPSTAALASHFDKGLGTLRK